MSATRRAIYVAGTARRNCARCCTTSARGIALRAMVPWPFVGMDCVEVAPPCDHAELTSHAAATFVWTYLCTRVAQGR